MKLIVFTESENVKPAILRKHGFVQNVGKHLSKENRDCRKKTKLVCYKRTTGNLWRSLQDRWFSINVLELVPAVLQEVALFMQMCRYWVRIVTTWEEHILIGCIKEQKTRGTRVCHFSDLRAEWVETKMWLFQNMNWYYGRSRTIIQRNIWKRENWRRRLL